MTDDMADGERLRLIVDACKRALKKGHRIDYGKTDFVLMQQDGKWVAPNGAPLCPIEALLLGRRALRMRVAVELAGFVNLHVLHARKLLRMDFGRVMDLIAGYDLPLVPSNETDHPGYRLGAQLRMLLAKKYSLVRHVSTLVPMGQ